MKYIDVDLLLKEIEKKSHEEQGFSSEDSEYGYRSCARDLLAFIDSLQQKQPEVDLEKEIDKYCEPIQAWQIQEAPYTSIENCARHFYELGLNVRKGGIVMKTEQKAKAYDEALEKAGKRIAAEPQDHTDAILKGIFPERFNLQSQPKQEEKEPSDKGEISDGYHTFNELYYYRMLYNAAFFNLLPKEWVHKSKRHYDGEECFGGGWFIVTANLPTGQISNHYEIKDWDLFYIPEKEIADRWDGHTPQEAAERLHKFLLEMPKQMPVEHLPKEKVYHIMRELSILSLSDLIPIESEEYKKIDEITSNVRDLLNYPIAKKENLKEDRWHKVEESLPDNGRLVLAKDTNGNILLARYDGENWEVEVYDNEDHYCWNVITKWCEIPFEVQKEQIPYIDFVIKPHKGDDTNPYDMSVPEAQYYAIKRGFGIPFNDGEVYVDERHITQTVGNILRWADEHPKEQKPSINIDQLKSLMLQYLQEAANEKDDSDIEADTDKWARKILEYDFEQKPVDDKAFEEWIDGWYNEHHRDGYITMDEREFKNFCRGIRNMYQQKPAEGIKGNLEEIPLNVDLEKELQAFLCNYDYEFDDDPVPFDIATHFYELGLNARKGEQEVDLEEFTKKMNAWKARFNRPDDIPIKATMAFTARMFYQYPNIARQWWQWYEQLPKATVDFNARNE